MPTLTQPALGSTAWGTQMNTNLQVLQNQLTNGMQGRIARVSATQIALQRYTGDTVEVNGLNVSMGSSGVALNTTDNLVTSTGADSGGAMAASTLYYVYLSNSNASPFATQLRASTTAPTAFNGIRYLGTSGNAANWRFIGYVRTDANTNFQDSDTQRFVVNYYNRIQKRLFLCPGYTNASTDTTWAIPSSWTRWNASASPMVEFLSNGEDHVEVGALACMFVTNGFRQHVGLGVDSSTNVDFKGTGGARRGKHVGLRRRTDRLSL